MRETVKIVSRVINQDPDAAVVSIAPRRHAPTVDIVAIVVEQRSDAEMDAASLRVMR